MEVQDTGGTAASQAMDPVAPEAVEAGEPQPSGDGSGLVSDAGSLTPGPGPAPPGVGLDMQPKVVLEPLFKASFPVSIPTWTEALASLSPGGGDPGGRGSPHKGKSKTPQGSQAGKNRVRRKSQGESLSDSEASLQSKKGKNKGGWTKVKGKGGKKPGAASEACGTTSPEPGRAFVAKGVSLTNRFDILVAPGGGGGEDLSPSRMEDID